jgi:hypothetical protein
MQKEISTQSIDYAQAIAERVAEMPIERVIQVYDFVCFLQTRPLPSRSTGADDDWLNDTEEHMQAEDALWTAAYARHHDKFAALTEAARAEIEAGETQPMFDEDNELLV